ncbi:MAG: flavodoxin-dependent (E)-4-hydroxy-3-methylbut-2-enyl-diphosphate synthase [Clostridia bacterium]|nr:flavodoxin-dependent (E)-4-hydroxy-3-methylbut-2-enyl-diphosphate synthase [Clostridia bacterium]
MKRVVNINGVELGNGDVVIQSMTNSKTYDTISTIEQINKLSDAGCKLVRVSIPDEKSAIAIKEIVKNVNVPIIGDIHYSSKFVLQAIKNGISKIRINPLNTPIKDLINIVEMCKDYNVAIRVGVNTGSDLNDYTNVQLVEKTLDCVKLIEDKDFSKIVISIKSSNVLDTISLNRILANKTDYPIHIGLTESGTSKFGSIKSTIAIGSLLCDNIGDTIRVSIPGDPLDEVKIAKSILRASGKDNNFVNIIACPTCSRTQIDVNGISNRLEKLLEKENKPLSIAIMGCVVNGLGESKDADISVCGGDKKSIIFYHGKQYKVVDNEQIENTLLELINKV